MHPDTVSQSPSPVTVDDHAMAAQHPVALLISGRARDEVETFARRVHITQFGQARPFVAVKASMFPRHTQMLQRHLAEPMATATGGSMFISDVEEMPIRAQDAFMKVLRKSVLAPPTGVRLVTGTTVSLLERIGAGHFNEELFYRLNVIHLVV